MAWRWGPGPVFVLEMRTAARRWQTYAVRVSFVAALLAAFCVVWWVDVPPHRKQVSVAQMARAGEDFYYGLIGTQLALLLLAAPAATAGAVSQDRSRGGLLHLLMTDLSDAEIIFGKLFARLLPVLGLLACGLPVPGIAMLVGGIAPDALFGAYLITAGATVLGCALALTISVWASRPSEALLGTYLILTLLLLPFPAWRGIGPAMGMTGPPTWLVKTNPFWLAFAPYLMPGTTDLSDAVAFLAVTLALSAGLTAVAVARVRPVTLAAAGRPDRPRHSRLPRRSWLPGPPLDDNPVLWREWHRRRPSRWERRVWSLYGLVAVGFSGLAIRSGDQRFAAWVNGLQVSIGLLLFSVAAVTSLAEERARASLDVLLTTPLTASQILWGKWWGSFRSAALLTVLPLAVFVGIAEALSGSALVMAVLILAYGAAFTSLGLAITTRVPQMGRAAALSAGACVLATVGWLALVGLLWSLRSEELCMGSPFFGPGNMTFHARHVDAKEVFGALAWSAAYAMIAVLLMATTLGSFDRHLGRVRQRADPQSVA